MGWKNIWTVQERECRTYEAKNKYSEASRHEQLRYIKTAPAVKGYIAQEIRHLNESKSQKDVGS
jgi:ribosomal protein RSM22 (predicted rRNA methylase)